MKIYTKTGDEGNTSLFGGERVRKSATRVDAYGTIDELNSLLGLVRTHDIPEQAQEWLETVQNALFYVGADLATPSEVQSDWVVRVDESYVTALETAIDQMDEELPALTSFILPGGSPAGATIHLARTVCRRAERVVVAVGDAEAINPVIVTYLNRLSDFLFTLARWVNIKGNVNETQWSVR